MLHTNESKVFRFIFFEMYPKTSSIFFFKFKPYFLSILLRLAKRDEAERPPILRFLAPVTASMEAFPWGKKAEEF